MMIIKLQPGFNLIDAASVVSVRCPSCRQRGIFVKTAQHDVQASDGTVLGQRCCPNLECKAHVFFVMKNSSIQTSYPAQRIDFDATSIPAQVLAAMEEALTCHASRCFIAAAIMVRKTLEELCRDRGATGGNLKERLRSLSSKVILPPELLEGLDDLRLLGNDAAHIESQEFDKVGQEEIELGIELAKEVLKAIYQYSALIQKLKGLKRGP